jgi:hypothetical protein
MNARRPAEPGRHWNPQCFADFWNNPDASRAIGSLTERSQIGTFLTVTP